MKKRDKSERTFNAKLFVRILPTTDFSFDSVRLEKNKKVLYVKTPQSLTKNLKPAVQNYWHFRTDGIFWNSSQEEVYKAVTTDLYDELFNGVRSLIFCYGQTGSGKTFTSSGLRYHFENRGLALRILSRLFMEKERKQEVTNITLGMSYVEFIGEMLKDLISNKSIQSFREIIEYTLPDENWAWKEIFKAETTKSFSKSAPYKGSNRGHSVLTFYIHRESLIDTDPIITHSKIHIVDMGGIDNVGNKPSEWKDKLDVGNANLSKSLMEQLMLCLSGASWKSENHICPYKSSRLLLYLHDTIQPKCLIRFIAHIYGNDSNLPITISTLKFGDKIKDFKPTKLEVGLKSNCALQMKNLEKEFLRLKNETELIGMLRDSPDYSTISQERLHEIRRAAEAFLFGQLENLTLFSLGQAALTLDVFRNLYFKLVAEKDQMVKDAVSAATEMLQAQIGSEKGSSLNLPIIPSIQKTSRRKSRQPESQISFGITFRSSDSGTVALGRVQSAVTQAGVIDRKSISIGPGKTASTYEGNITKAFKKLRSRKSDNVLSKNTKSVSTKEFGSLSSKQNIDDALELSQTDSVPSKETAWQNFLSERIELATELRNTVKTNEEGVLTAKRRYLANLSELAKLREEIEECKFELQNCQHIRQIYGKSDYSEEGNIFPGDLEKCLIEMIAHRKEQINGAIENCHIALVDLRSVVEELNEARKNLDEAFQEFCKEQYKIVFVTDETIPTDSKSNESEQIFSSESYFKIQAQKELYSQLQEKILNHVPKAPKKEWITLF